MRVGDRDWRTVIGVAADVKYSRINEAPRPYFYLPFFQAYRSNINPPHQGRLDCPHRSRPPAPPGPGTAPVDHLVDQARARVVALDADLPILTAKPIVRMMRGALIFYNLTATMLFVFGVAGMALAAMGTYGLVA